MAWDINRVILVGRLASDVDFRSTPNGNHIAKFGIAVGGRPNQDGSDSVSFFNVVVWGKTAEVCDKYLSKGKQVALDGHLTQNRWQAQDGTNRSKVEIVADRVEFLGSSGGGNQQGGGQYNSNKVNKPSSGSPFDDVIYDNTDFDPTPLDSRKMDDDVPF